MNDIPDVAVIVYERWDNWVDRYYCLLQNKSTNMGDMHELYNHSRSWDFLPESIVHFIGHNLPIYEHPEYLGQHREIQHTTFSISWTFVFEYHGDIALFRLMNPHIKEYV